MKPEKIEELQGRMELLGIRDEDLVEKFILGSGKGGQKINKTSSCVYLKHLPSGFEIKCQKSRSREMNRFFARRELCIFIEEQREGIKSERQQRFEKIRRQKRKRSKRAQEKVLKDKKIHSDKKRSRSLSE
jgi:protein subunit release factor B